MIAKAIRDDFPILKRSVNDEPLVYLDNAATTQKPKQVIQALEDYYFQHNANIHRGVHTLAQEATEAYEEARDKVRNFIKAKSTKEVLFTRGTTTGLNWVAKGFAQNILTAGDQIFISPMEHHSNLVPWQEVARKTGAQLVYMPLLTDGSLDMPAINNMMSEKTKIMAITHISNVLGVTNPVKQLGQWMHETGGYMVVDGAQAAPHMPIDVGDLDCDFYAFSGHKMLGPTGIGVLYGKEKLLEVMEPQETGGEMIDFVYEQSSTWKELPWKFEAGTPNIAGAIGLGKAIDYLQAIGMQTIQAHEQAIVDYLLPKLTAIPGVHVYGPAETKNHSAVISFTIDGIHPHDIATAMDMEGIAIRAGHHCAQPLMRWLDVSATARVSFYIYNTLEEADFLLATIEKVKEFFHNGTI